ncbi:MAG TPA: Ig-like domain-containing protein [Candidatus Omnitrophota bacterium]|nr:Ig-like domain-containing protein [Candidatus Omnitrophota bacterium]
MKAVKLFFLMFAAIFLMSFISAASQSISINSTTGQAGQYSLYNITIQNTDALYNITRVDVNFYGLTVDSSSSGSSIGIANSSSGLFTFVENPGAINRSTTQYFWFNLLSSQVGIFLVNVTTTDNQSITNSQNLSITISDTINPTISFSSPTPSYGSILNSTYIPVNVSVNDSGSGIKNVTFFLYDSSNNLVGSNSDSSFPYSYNYTGLNSGTYYLSAIVFDNANNSASVSESVQIAEESACIPSWTCTWSDCVNGTQTASSCTDANNCGAVAPVSQTCKSSCTSNWDCAPWAPEECSGNETQTRLCNDLNGCSPPDTQTRICVTAGASTANSSGLPSLFSSSTLFFVILGVIIASVVAVVFILMRLKKKSSSQGGDSNGGYKTYTPRGPPPSMPPPSLPPSGYANPPRMMPANQGVY